MMDWDTYFLNFATLASRKSKDSTQVGCVIVGPDMEIRATGFNGIPRGVRDLGARMDRPAKYLWTSHAEENAVAHAARVGVSLKGCVAYVTHQPCARCARMLIQAGIATVCFMGGTTSMPAEEFKVAMQMFEEAHVAVMYYGNQPALPDSTRSLVGGIA
jgi:dCMP deaminase